MAKKVKKGQERLYFKEVAQMAAKLKDESDRGAALIVTAWVDDALTEMVINHLVHDEKTIEVMFHPMGPLGSFSSKIRLAFLLGIINKLVFENLEVIRGIRNDFAHSRTDLQFSDVSIRDRCRNLMLKKLKGDSTKTIGVDSEFIPRKAFVATGLALTGFFIEFRSAPTMSSDRREDYFPQFMELMANEMVELLSKFTKPVKETG